MKTIFPFVTPEDTDMVDGQCCLWFGKKLSDFVA